MHAWRATYAARRTPTRPPPALAAPIERAPEFVADESAPEFGP
jgi:hypothetical protein